MHVCTKSFLKTTTNSSCVCTHLANKADSDSDLILNMGEKNNKTTNILLAACEINKLINIVLQQFEFI